MVSVYKGKVLSGDLVAVKMLVKSRTNAKDFMNEVARKATNKKNK